MLDILLQLFPTFLLFLTIAFLRADTEQKQHRRNMRRVLMPDTRPQRLPGGPMVPWNDEPLPWQQSTWYAPPLESRAPEKMSTAHA
jgi:hypothetical protein